MKRFTTRLSFALCLLISAAAAQQPMPTSGTAIDVISRPVALNPEAPSEIRVGLLSYQGGVELISANSDFGGFSGLMVAADQSHLVAVTDRGHWLCATIELDASNTLRGVNSAWMARLESLPDYDLGDKKNADAETIAVTADLSSAYVAFEGNHRIWRYEIDDRTDLCSVAVSAPTPVTVPRNLSLLPTNGGIESVAVLPGGDLIMIGEDKIREINAQPGWLGKAATAFTTFSYASPQPFSPTDMKAIDGGYLILHRHFSVFSGVSGAIGWSAHQPGTSVPGPSRMIAEFAPPLSVDNFEGLSAVTDGKDGYTIYILSDDNFSPFQRTLLMKFSLSKSALSSLKQSP